MSCRIRSGSGTDIPSLDIADHYKIFFLAVIHRFLKCHYARHAELLIHCNLRLDSGDQVTGLIHDLFVKLPDRFCSSFKCFSVFRKRLILHMLRDIVQHRVKSDHDRRSCLFDLFH